MVSHGGFTISSSMVVQLGLMLTLIVQYSKSVFFQKGTCSIIHGSSLFDMVVTTQPLLTCKKTTGERTDIPGCHGCLWYVGGMAKSVGVAEPRLQHFLCNGWFLNGKSNRINRGPDFCCARKRAEFQGQLVVLQRVCFIKLRIQCDQIGFVDTTMCNIAVWA